MQATDLLIKAIKTLPENRITQVLDFVEFIKQQEARTEPLYNAETIAAIKEGDAMLRGEIPAKWYNSLEEMLVDLDSDD